MVGTWVHKLNFVEAKDPGKKDFEAEQKCFSRLKEMNYSIILESLKFRSGRRGWHVKPAGGFQNWPQFRWDSKAVKQKSLRQQQKSLVIDWNNKKFNWMQNLARKCRSSSFFSVWSRDGGKGKGQSACHTVCKPEFRSQHSQEKSGVAVPACIPVLECPEGSSGFTDYID